MVTLFLFFLNFYSVLTSPLLRETTCQKECHTIAGKFNVHLIPHSHDDVGWVKTYQQYYEGTGKFDKIANAGVKYILDSTIEALNKSADRRFVQVETAFFYKWWNDQTPEIRNLVKELVNNGQLEIVNGGWSMNDEATTNYQSIIDQFTWGFRILEDTLGECGRPKIGWQIDPFGHSREHAFINKQLGFEGLVVGRIDYRDKEKRIEEQNLDFIWITSDSFEEDEANIFTSIFPNFYTYEEGFCFDVYCNDTEISDDNLDEKVEAFTKILDIYKNYSKTNNIMIPMGHDFSYQKAEKNFGNLDKLIAGFKNHETYNVIYSTPSCYFSAIKAYKEQLSNKTDDFFPHATDEHSFWTGYFTSRPTLKRFERIGNNILQSVKQLTTFSRVRGYNDDSNILKLRMAMGIMQHHDAITGTEKQAVANDYSSILTEGIKEAQKPISNIVKDLLKKSDEVDLDLNLSTCLLANVSVCETTKANRFIVIVQNPLSRKISHYVRLPVDSESYNITGPEEDGDVEFDIFDAMHSFDFIKGANPLEKELVFLAKDLPPLGLKLYYMEKLEGTSNNYHQFTTISDDRSFGSTTTNGFSIGEDGKLKSVTIRGLTLDLTQEFLYYDGWVGNNSEPSQRSSGAYIFRPKGNGTVISGEITNIEFAKGNLVDEVRQIVNEDITQIIRMYKGEEDFYIEFDWLIGDLPVNSGSRELITRFTVASFEHDNTFYTDSNGRQQIQRIRNKRNGYDYNTKEEPISSNYYPVTSRIVIKNDTLEVAVLNDRAQGGSSLEEGQIELLIHRREQKDDDFGVDEALNETQYGKGLYVRGQHYLTFDVLENNPVVFEKKLAHKKLLAPLVLVANASEDDLTLEKVQDSFNFEFEGLTKSLPDNVQILTLEPWKDSYILRLEHIFEKEEANDLLGEVYVDLTNLFTLFNINELTAVNLGANENLETTPNLNVTIKPMEIKTFIFKTDKNNNGGHENGVKGGANGSQGLKSFSALIVFVLCLYLY